MFEFHSNQKEFQKTFIPQFRKEWITEARKFSDLTLHKGKELPRPTILHADFVPVCTYMNDLFLDLAHYKLKMDGIEEVDYWERKGGMCIYLSVLMYVLLTETGVATEQSLKFVQGIYQHKSNPQSFAASFFPSNHVGLHSWLTLSGAVLDMSIAQERDFFDLGSSPYILGSVPEGMTLLGFIEPKKTVNKYVERFAKQQEISTQDWISRHVQQYHDYTQPPL